MTANVAGFLCQFLLWNRPILGYFSQKYLSGSDGCILAPKAQNLRNQGYLELNMHDCLRTILG